MERHEEALRGGRGPASLGGSTLDLKLGGRMLVKHPGLTIAGRLAMALAIWVGAIALEMPTLIVSPSVPLPGGIRRRTRGRAPASWRDPRTPGPAGPTGDRECAR
ncbi:MAG TPA: hypothetical protein VFS08_18195 [Gemmatimonadaceae bacterium]|nr:hypothetical protein [Gemmatimonadaceae bacterium]